MSREDQRPTDRWLAAQCAVAALLQEAGSLAEAGPGLLEHAGRAAGWEAGTLWVPAPDGTGLRPVASWGHPQAPHPAAAAPAEEGSGGSGLPERVWSTGRPAWVEAARPPGPAGIRSAAAFPVRCGPAVLGVMEFAATRVVLVDEDVQRAMAAIGAQAGQFAERVRAQEELRRAEEGHRAVAERALWAERQERAQHALTVAMAAAATVEEAGTEILRAIGTELGWSMGRLWVVEPDRSLRLLAAWPRQADAGTPPEGGATRDPGPGEGLPRRVLAPGEGLAGRARALGRVAWTADLGTGQGGPRPSGAAPARGRAAVAVPILLEGQVFGVLELFGREPGPPDPHAVEAASAIGPRVALYLRRKRIEQGARDSEALRSAMLDAAHDCVIGMDAHGRIVEFNPAAERAFGYRRADVLGRDLADLIIPPPLRARHRASLRRCLETGQGTILGTFVEMTAMRADGSEFPVELMVTRVDLAGGPVFTGFLRDVTGRKQAESEIAYLAYHDRLTGLPNRAKFEEALEMAIARARRHHLAVALLYLDMDNFKLVNDSLGHTAGDHLLREVAARLTSLSRDTDLVARLGGDEFLILLTDLPQAAGASGVGPPPAHVAVERVARRVQQCLTAPFALEGTELYVSASIGASVFPLDAADARTMFMNADAAMYRSKRAGPGGVEVSATAVPADHRSKLSLVTRLRRATERGDWALLYQPVVDLVRGEMVGAEALLRWKDPGRGLIGAGQFLPLAEEMGFMDGIGEWVLDALLRQCGAWQAEGLPVDVGFNISPRQMWHPGFERTLLERIDGAGVDPGCLIVEVTESAAMADADRTQEVLTALRGRGLRCAIDDFGTGHSSLGRLRELPVDLLKIDRSFIRDLPDNDDARTMVRAIIQLAHSLGMAPLAEGIEDEAQWRFLVDQGCLLGQGFYFHRPTTAEELTGLWRRSGFRLRDTG